MPAVLAITDVASRSEETLLFQEALLKPRWPWPAVTSSALFHAALLASVYLLAPPFSAAPQLAERKAAIVAKVQVLYFPERLQVVPMPRLRPPQQAVAQRISVARPNKVPEPRRVQPLSADAASIREIQTASNASTPPAHKVFVAPELKPITVSHASQAGMKRVQQTIVRPDIPVTQDTSIRLPSFLAWSKPAPAPAPAPVAPAPKAVVHAATAESDSIASHAISLALPTPSVRHQLTVVDVANQQREDAGPKQSPVQVLSIAPSLMPIPRTLVVPPLNQVAGDGEKSASGQASPDTLTQNQGSAPSGSEVASGGSSTSPGQGQGSGNAERGASVLAGTGHSSRETGHGVEAGNSGGSGTAASSIPPEHFTGSFDVVIEQSTADRGIPEAANFLHGKPVYTVYVQMQDVKEWILEYCFEEDRSPDRAGSAVVILTAPPRVDAPFPLEMIRPLGRLTTKSRYLLLHGTINTEGKPVGFQSGYTDDPEYAKAAVNAVGLWKFRPAKRDGVPAVVEAVLAIPSAGR